MFESMIDHLKIKVSQFQKLLTNNFSKFFLTCHQFKRPKNSKKTLPRDSSGKIL